MCGRNGWCGAPTILKKPALASNDGESIIPENAQLMITIVVLGFVAEAPTHWNSGKIYKPGVEKSALGAGARKENSVFLT